MLTISGLTYRVGGRQGRALLNEANAQIPDGSKIGLVGRNGAGKSTLLDLIRGRLMPDTGDVFLPRGWRIGFLAQEPPHGTATPFDTVLAADKERAALLRELERGPEPLRIAEIEARLDEIGARSAPARAGRILAGLGLDAAMQQRPLSELSGGWRMRVALAAVLFSEPDLLLLDEPTNYLDLEGTLWLTDHLARYPRTFIVISHDRDLLDDAVEWILHIDGGKLELYRGGYTSFARQRAERQAQNAAMAKKQEAERKHLQAFVDRFKAKASKARQAQSRVKKLARLTPIAAIANDEVRAIQIPPPAKPLSPPIVALDRISVGYEPDKPVLRRLTLRIDTDDRIALLGPNGNGKSTLAKLLAGRLAPSDGTITRPDRIEVAYFAQHQLDELIAAQSVYHHVRRLMPDAPEAKVRARAGSIGFTGERADTPVEMLSGGEKARLLLGFATFAGPHLIILDEPTNHLDIDSRAALIEAINDYPGAAILVSHDRHLIEACADRLWLVGDGTVAPYEGDLDDYRRLVLGRDAKVRDSAEDATKVSRTDQRRAAAEKREELKPLK